MTPSSTLPSSTFTTPHLLFSGRRLAVLRAAWISVAIMAIFVFVMNAPYFFAVTLQAAQAQPQPGITPQASAIFDFIQSCLFMLGFWAVAYFLFWRKSNDGVAYLVSLMLLTTGTMYAGVYQRGTPYLFLNVLINSLGETSQITFFYMFPDGRFFPKWFRYAVVPLFIFRVLIWLNIYINDLPQGAIEVGLLAVLALIGIGLQVRRYRKLATPTQRQQLKWLLVGLVIALIAIIPTVYILSIGEVVTYENNVWLTIILKTVRNLAMLSVPITLAFSIFRYRLWDIDLTINKSVVYGLATLILVGLFVIGFGLMQRLFTLVLGEAQTGLSLAIAGTLTGVMFNPTRLRVRKFVDRRLYGFRFDLDQLTQAQLNKPAVKNPSALTGQHLGDYEVLDVIGRGGMGEVYKGFHNGQIVALKVLPDEMNPTDDAIERFQREVRTLSTLQHPNIVKFYGAAIDHKPPYMVLEYVEGRTLRDYLREKGQLPVEEVLTLLKPLTNALDYIHAQGIIHRDLKPSNIMLRPKGGGTYQVLIMDFGIAKSEGITSNLTGTGAIGTIDYMAPEQIYMARDVDWRADIYALGVICFEMLTAQRPFVGNPGQVLFGHLQQPPPDPRTIRPDLPPALARAVRRAMAKTTSDRFESAGEMLLDAEDEDVLDAAPMLAQDDLLTVAVPSA
ncbi:MAG: protein kinase [Anaerolineae bacterium]|nr:protein kinase [Anaerolineae bacterium]